MSDCFKVNYVNNCEELEYWVLCENVLDVILLLYIVNYMKGLLYCIIMGLLFNYVDYKFFVVGINSGDFFDLCKILFGLGKKF